MTQTEDEHREQGGESGKLGRAEGSFYLLERPLLRWAGSGASRDRRFFPGRRTRVGQASALGGQDLLASRPLVAGEVQ